MVKKTGSIPVFSDDSLCHRTLLERLGEKRMERVLCFDSVDSTNTRLKLLARSGAATGTVLMANHQSAGRGRLGRSFSSPSGEGVYLSMLLRPDCTAEEAQQLTAWTAVAVQRAVKTVSGADCKIKWVNDLILDGRKLAGILTELSVGTDGGKIDHIVVGVGVNVRQTSFPSELSEIATSLAISTGKTVSRCDLAAELVRRLDKLSNDFPAQKSEYLSAYRENCVTLGKEVSFSTPEGSYCALATRIDDGFGLELGFADGSVRLLRTGEVSVRGLHGYI